ncbi:sigma-54-dependent Fis family transcriptional regulator [Christiangramia fulva]|uniref:Sigma-54-dependent Fis family transcriptional regulator n=1 Tax=Christiangramia fulva TaxID=2126553 RepID=A0A2R3Z4M3_9FLAO|nr:sigma-54 dependent transcriptional regulator [Christiangramia fulva]AVR45178.1 sigma-54-dependent Fis family transcriptional regulator [Christiangramia fulva]
MKKTILIIDDEKDILNMLSRIIELEGYNVFKAPTGKEAIKLFKKERIHVVITDVKLPDISGIELVNTFKEINKAAEIICLTAYGKIEDGVKAIKQGAFDYLVKGDDNKKILPLLSKAYDKAELQYKILRLKSQISEQFGFNRIIGSSKPLKNAIEMAKRVAPMDTTVLILGPTGSGKEVFSRAIHSESNRATESFLAINCSALGKDLLESELFGHKAGAFTGAIKDKPGLFEEAHLGTILLDEIGEMDLELQAKLLRFLEEGTFIPLGESREKKVDVRVISATNKNLQKAVEEGAFREDLYYRLSVFTIDLPGLDQRKKDIPALANYFVKNISLKANKNIKTVSKDFIQALQEHHWKGNIRELRNIIERSIILANEEKLTADLLPFDFLLNSNPGLSTGLYKLKDVEKEHIRNLLKYTKGNKTKTAELLDIGLTTLYNKVKEYELE